MISDDLRSRAQQPLVLYVDVLPYMLEVDGSVRYLLFRRRGDVVMPSTWQPACGKLTAGAGIARSFEDQIRKKTGASAVCVTPIDYLHSYYDHHYDAVLMVPCAGARLADPAVKLDADLHDEYRWVAYEEIQRYVHFRGQLAAYAILNSTIAAVT